MNHLVGQIKLFAGSKIPVGWLPCNGQLLTILDYPLLFSVIGTLYDTNAGEGTFRLPDAQGRAIMGVGAGVGLTPRTLGTLLGEETSVIGPNDMPHSHGLYHSGDVPVDTTINNGAMPAEIFHYTKKDAPTYTSNTMNSGAIEPISDAGQPHNNMQPYSAINLIICALGKLG